MNLRYLSISESKRGLKSKDFENSKCELEKLSILFTIDYIVRIKLPVVDERQHLLDTDDNANANIRRRFCNFSMLKLHRRLLDVALLRYVRNFQLVVIEMPNCRNRHRFHCDSTPPNG